MTDQTSIRSPIPEGSAVPSQLPLISANSGISSNKSTISSPPPPEKKVYRYLSTKRSLPKEAARRLRFHLSEILPLRNVPKDPNRNLVIAYAENRLEGFGRGITKDSAGNLISLSHRPEELRAVVAHTDSVDQNKGDDVEAIFRQGGLIHSVRRLRPIGGDDKVGVAIALVIAEFAPEISVLLLADEEGGCDGAKAVDIPQHVLAVECDRRGSCDLVDRILQQDLMDYSVKSHMKGILPHRNVTTGSNTDVKELVSRELALNAVNLSCGYHKPHTSDEFVVLTQAHQALADAWSLLFYLPIDMEPVKITKPYTYTPHPYESKYPLSSAKKEESKGEETAVGEKTAETAADKDEAAAVKDEEDKLPVELDREKFEILERMDDGFRMRCESEILRQSIHRRRAERLVASKMGQWWNENQKLFRYGDKGVILRVRGSISYEAAKNVVKAGGARWFGYTQCGVLFPPRTETQLPLLLMVDFEKGVRYEYEQDRLSLVDGTGFDRHTPGEGDPSGGGGDQGPRTLPAPLPGAIDGEPSWTHADHEGDDLQPSYLGGFYG
jgi:hypothetical protein